MVIYDRLVDYRLVASAAETAEMIDTTRLSSEPSARQDSINALMVARAQDGKSIVRLKGGDPFIFGRGGEEAQALADEGITFEVVPGVTSAIAAPAYAGIPLTVRGVASTFTVVTGSEAPGKASENVPWDVLARQGGTLVVLMGWKNLPGIAETLIREGRPADTPAAVVQWGTEPYQRTVDGTLADIADRARDAELAPPVAIVVGEVVAQRRHLRWYDDRPLFGTRVLVTRSRSQSNELTDLLSREGAHPIEAPTIQVEPLEDHSELDAELAGLSGYDLVVFASTNAVDAVFRRLEGLTRDARAFGQARVAAIGASTSAALTRRGITADIVPDEFVSESVAKRLKSEDVAGKRVLLPRSDIGRDALATGLRDAGAKVHSVTAYRTVMPKDAGSRLRGVFSEGVDVVTFTSSSTVRNLVSLLEGDLGSLQQATIACIGPVTAATAREVGLRPDIVAREHTASGLVEAIKGYFFREVDGPDD